MTQDELLTSLHNLEAEYWELIPKENLKTKTPKTTAKLDDLENAIRVIKGKLQEGKKSGRRKSSAGVVQSKA